MVPRTGLPSRAREGLATWANPGEEANQKLRPWAQFAKAWVQASPSGFPTKSHFFCTFHDLNNGRIFPDTLTLHYYPYPVAPAPTQHLLQARSLAREAYFPPAAASTTSELEQRTYSLILKEQLPVQMPPKPLQITSIQGCTCYANMASSTPDTISV